MNISRYILTCIVSLLAFGSSMTLTSCSDDDGGGQPVIERVRLTDPEKAVYGFHVIAGEPTIDYYKADMPLNSEGIPEMQPGQIVELHGSLLHEIDS